MSRPKTKSELVAQSSRNFNKLIAYVDSFSDTDKSSAFPPGMMNRNIRDVLAHIHHWHLMLLGWNEVGMTGRKPDMPAKGYTWKTTPALNKKIWEDYQNVSLDKVLQLLHQSFSDVQKIMEHHSNEALFEKKRFKWTGSTSLGTYLVSATSSHYDWAYKLIRKAMKKR